MGSSKKVTIGHKYYFGIHMGLCRGPIDELVEIKVADKTAWQGSVLGNLSVYINQPNLFGGEKGEGGIQGLVDVMMGDANQLPNNRLTSMMGYIYPAFRGVCTLFYDGLVTALSPYPKPWSVRGRRALKGWDGDPWYPEKAVISLQDGAIKPMNPAHMLYECLTNRDWGRGLDRTKLDDAAYRAAADILYAEGFGLCIKWTRQGSIAEFMQSVLDHIGATQFLHRTTGLMTLRLIRDDYDPETLPLFDYDSGLLLVEDDNNSAPAIATNEIVVKYRDPVTNEKRSVRIKNHGAIQTAGIASETVEYMGLPTAELAARVAQRDLRAKSGLPKRFKVRLDRRGYQIEPGQAFRIRALDHGIESMVLRAGRIEDGTLADGAITITGVQDMFGLPSTSYAAGQPPLWVPPDTTPQAITESRLMELPYRDMVATLDPANAELLDDTSCNLGSLGIRPTSLSLYYQLETRVGSNEWATRESGDFCPSGRLVDAIDPNETVITLTGMADLDDVSVGTAALLNNEIVRVDSIDPINGVVGIGRACADTVPATHALDSRIWFYDDRFGRDETEYSPGVTVEARLLTRTSSGLLDPALAGTDNLLMAQRFGRPYPPGLFRVNGTSYPQAVSGAITLSWAHRDRLLQADQLVDTQQGNIGPEPGTTYTVSVFDNTTLKRTYNTASTAQDYVDADVAADGYIQTLRITLHSSRDGLDSWQSHDITFERYGLGFHLGNSLGGGIPA